FAHLVDHYGATELDQVHRFTHEWERQASLRLRAGDPTVLAEHERHGRIHGGAVEQMETGIVDAWHRARSRGEPVALMANSTGTVARRTHLAQRTRVEAGELAAAAPALQVGDQRLGLGDEVVTRRNHRTLRTDEGHMFLNRDNRTITTIHSDRTVSLDDATGTLRLPAYYAAEHLVLGYPKFSLVNQRH